MSTTEAPSPADRGSGSNDLLGLVERLRQRRLLAAEGQMGRGRPNAKATWLTDHPDPDCAAAADEIERLQAALAASCDEHRSEVYDTTTGGGCVLLRDAVAAERERWLRIATNAQAVTTGCIDKIDYFEVPSHLMAALALALDEGPNA